MSIVGLTTPQSQGKIHVGQELDRLKAAICSLEPESGAAPKLEINAASLGEKEMRTELVKVHDILETETLSHHAKS